MVWEKVKAAGPMLVQPAAGAQHVSLNLESATLDLSISFLVLRWIMFDK